MAYEIGNTCFEQQKYDKAISSYKRYLYFEPKGVHVDEVCKKISECSKLMGKIAKAFINADN